MNFDKVYFWFLLSPPTPLCGNLLKNNSPIKWLSEFSSLQSLGTFHHCYISSQGYLEPILMASSQAKSSWAGKCWQMFPTNVYLEEGILNEKTSLYMLYNHFNSSDSNPNITLVELWTKFIELILPIFKSNFQVSVLKISYKSMKLSLKM